jgi:DivIVA domain-containing protein
MVAVSTEDALSAEDVAGKEFPVTFRGFGQHEVRAFLAQVAAELAAARERERLQRQRLEAAEARAAVRKPTEEQIEAALGEGAGKLLHAAGEAAAEIRAKAEKEAARLIAEATGTEARAQEEAESLLAERTQEAERQAAEVLADAEREAEAQVEEAKAEGRAMVAEAQAVRERILKDLVRRRRLAHQQLEQLRAGRERLLEAYRVVRSTLDEATRELSVAEGEARAAAETAALRSSPRSELSIAEIESELSAARDAGLTLARSGVGGRRRADVNGSSSVNGGAPAEVGPTDPEPVGAVSPDEVAEALAEVVEPAPEVAPPDTARLDRPPEAAEPVAEVAEPAEQLDVLADGSTVADPSSDAVDPVPEVAEITDPVPDAEDPVPAVAGLGDAAEHAEHAELEAEAARPGPHGEAEPVATRFESKPSAVEPEPSAVDKGGAGSATTAPVAFPAAPEPASPAQQPPESEIERLFARIRADREAAVARAEAVLSEPEASRGAPEPASSVGTDRANGSQRSDAAQPPPADAHPDHVGVSVPTPEPAADDERLLQERDAQIEPLERVLLRSLKRALADEQNEVLDTLRRHRGGWSVADLLPDPADHVGRYVAVVSGDLEAAAIQGARGAGGGEAPLVDDLASALASEVADDLRARLQRAVDAADGDQGPLRDGISSAYREWKTSWAHPLVRHHVATAHARGRFAAVADVALRWVVDDDEGACPDCDDNALAGPTPKGQPFPTGQEHPPAHVGCRCMVVPEAS